MSEDIRIDDELVNESSEEQEFFEHHRFVVDKGQTIDRIDKYLCMHMANTSRNKIQMAAKADCILVNEKPVKSNYRIKPFDVISVVLPHPPHVFELLAEDIPIHILYEDDDIMVVDKEAGMVVHPGHGNYTGTLVNALLHHFKHLPRKGEEDIRPGLVHRIDKNTSGILVIAKHDLALSRLALEFYNHTIKRVYTAIAWGVPAQDEGTINGYIGRDPRNRKAMTVHEDDTHAKHAITHYKVLEKLHYISLVECRLETGRTHQIRVHFKHIGHPLFNDATYGGDAIIKGTTFSKYKKFVQNCFDILPRQALHARYLGFNHPIHGKFMEFNSPIPDDMTQVLDKWRRYTSEME